MAFLSSSSEDEVMNEINMTPLIDVMLVLLIVFIMAVPAIHGAVALTLPKVNSPTRQQPSEPVRLDIDAQGLTYWNEKKVDELALKAHAQQAAFLNPQPVVQLRGDRAVSYELVLKTLETLQGAGLAKVNFLSQRP
ncbi:MAG: biopolymer transporter ExbD [Betaproteobacteria bacterium]|jgi:biopolymer transport protein ExbD|nr:biopolymer transporter ExbD [Betaproteobacteria bacterium]NBY72322.1 biopolymer transporter ExbD [Betaproteobacteria bacterium]